MKTYTANCQEKKKIDVAINIRFVGFFKSPFPEKNIVFPKIFPSLSKDR